MRRFLLFFLLSWQVTNAQEYFSSPDLRILHTPEWVMIDGKPTLYYELVITNFSSDTLILEKLNVLNKELKLQQRLLPNAFMIVYIEANPSAGAILEHRLTVNGNVVNGAWPGPIKQTPMNLGPPLGKGNWVAIYEPSWERGHRRVVYTVDGKSRIPGRFAIDFVKVDDAGHFAKGNSDSIENHLGYNASVLAVADGTVLATKNDFPESALISKHINPDPAKAAGNYISIDLGNGHIAFYEHLKPGSVQVKPGDKVRKGQPIAALGFTGQTTGPHLHFHIANANSTLGAEGIPFAFEQFNSIGFYPSLDKFGQEPFTPHTAPTVRKKERPAPNTVIRF